MRNVLVTGGSRGLGLGIARRLASSGYCVIAVSRKESHQLASAIHEAESQATGRLHFVSFDLADIRSLPALAKNLRTTFGTIYGLVNNAGISAEGVLGLMPDSTIEHLLRVNTLSPIILTKYVARSMIAA